MTKLKFLLVGLAAVGLGACNAMTTQNPDAAPMAETVMEETTPVPWTYALTAQNDSGQTGTLTLSETADGKVMAVLAMMGGNFTAPQPAHIHLGHCPTPGAVKYPLTNVVNGQSTTTLDVTMAELMAAAPEMAVNVHKSAQEASVYTACGDIK